MRQFYLGIDIGGTRTRAVLLNGSSMRCSMGETEGCNPIHCDASKIKEQLERSVESARENWRKKYGDEINSSQIRSYYISSAGFTDEEGKECMRRLCAVDVLNGVPFDIDMEMRVTFFGALGGQPGISLVVGTGSACYAEDAAGNSWQSGGWENLVSDEGGGYYLGLKGMIAAVRMSDGRLPPTRLRDAVFHALEIKSVSSIISRLHSGPMTKAEIAALSSIVLRLSEQEDPCARKIVREAVEELVLMVEATYENLPFSRDPEIAVTGGMMRSKYYRNILFDAIRKKIPAANVHLPEFSPVVGAAILAMKLDNNLPSREMLDQLKTVVPCE